MGLFSGCLLACDVDGTLMCNNIINPVNIEKIKFFVKEGGLFSLSTGRTISAVNMVLRILGDFISPSIMANGGMIYDFKDDKILYEALLPKEDYKIVKEVLALNKDIGIEVHSGKSVFVLNRNEETDIHESYEEMEVTPCSYEEAAAYRWNKVLFAGKPENLEVVKALVKNTKLESNFFNTSAIIYNRTFQYFEQVPKNVSKASALDNLCEILNIDAENCYAIGDYYNDIEIIKTAAIGAAPCDSPDEVKTEAGYITVPADDGAVADFIDFLTQKKGCKK